MTWLPSVSPRLVAIPPRRCPQPALGLERLTALLRKMDPTEATYLFLDRSQVLREENHGLLQNRPLAGLGLEVTWRSLYREMGRDVDGLSEVHSVRTSSLSTDLPGTLKAVGGRFLRSVAANDLHLVYMAGVQKVVRWDRPGRHCSERCSGHGAE